MSTISKITRRGFLKGTASLAGASLVLGVTMPSSSLFASEWTGSFDPSLYISIAESGKITLTVPHSEMGQGTRTGLMQILAEELEANWEEVGYEQALAKPEYGNMGTVGSYSIKIRYEPFRQAGAAAREMLVSAAAQILKVPATELAAREGQVHHDKSKRSLGYGELVKVAATLPVPENPTLKNPKDFKFIGKPVQGVDLDDIGQGKAVYGIDVDIPGMVHASIERSPSLAGKIKSYDKAAALKVSGVLDVVEVPGNGIWTNNGIAVIATNTWASNKGRKALKAEWDHGSAPLETDKTHRATLAEIVDQPGNVARSEGDYEKAKSSADKKMSASYYSPYLAHSPMEPLVAVASVTGDTAEVWAPSQLPQFHAIAAGGVLGHKPPAVFEKVKFHTTLLGGAFGRKGKPDHVVEAVTVSKLIGKPVKVTWTREDEIRHGYYRGASLQKYEAALDKNGYPVGFKAMSVFPTMVKSFNPAAIDPSPAEIGMGLSEMPYRIENVHIATKGVKTDVRIGFWRSVTHPHHAWAMNNFFDELAEAAGEDSIAYRLKLLGDQRLLDYKDWKKYAPAQNYLDIPFDTGRLSQVIRTVRDQSQWGKTMPKGRALGFSTHKSFNSYLAMVFEVSIEAGQVVVHKVDAAVDIGTVVNPSYVKAQVEGGIVFGLSATLYGEITLDQGVVQQSNFHDYRMLRINEMPEVAVTLIESDEKPTGIGEPGVPLVAPAVCNAIFNLTGKRIYELPLSKHELG